MFHKIGKQMLKLYYKIQKIRYLLFWILMASLWVLNGDGRLLPIFAKELY
jgi:hypothetical protein